MSAHHEAVAAREHAWGVALSESRVALRHWARHPRELAPWILVSAGFAAVLLIFTLVFAGSATPRPIGSSQLIAADPSSRLSDYGYVYAHNGTVLLLHLLVLFATYLARRSIPLQAERMSGLQAAVHRHAAGPAMVLVGGLAVFSIVQQALVLGQSLADVAAARDTTPAGILVRLLPHAVPELVAVFLPLGAALWLQHKNRTGDLLAAIAACVIVAVPTILVAGWVEVAVASALF